MWGVWGLYDTGESEVKGGAETPAQSLPPPHLSRVASGRGSGGSHGWAFVVTPGGWWEGEAWAEMRVLGVICV